MSELLPCLKDADWPGSDATVARLLWNGEQSDYMPWVALGYDHPHTFEFLPRATLAEMGKSEQEVERDALRALRERPAAWEPWDVKLGFFKKLKMLACGNDYLAAERILDPVFMREAQQRLKAKMLLAGVPRRGALMVTDAKQDKQKLKHFLAIICQQFAEGGSPPISPAAFAVDDGRIIGVFDALARAIVPVLESQEEAGAEDEGPYITRMVLTNKETGQETPLVCGHDSDFDRLANHLVTAVGDAVVEHLKRPVFSGRVDVEISCPVPDLDQRAAKLQAFIQGMASEMASAAGRTVEVSLSTQHSDR